MNFENAFRTVLEHSRKGIYIVTPDRTIVFWNSEAENITGYSRDEIVGQHCQETMLKHIDASGIPLCELNCPLIEAAASGTERVERVTVRHKDGYRVPIRTRFIPIREQGRVVAVAELFERISSEVYDDGTISTLSYELMHDKLTGLPNAEYMKHYLNYKFAEYLMFGHGCAVLIADIDQLEDFQDKHRQAYGDALLTQIGNAIRAGSKKSDLVGRIGGGRFMGIYMFKDMSRLGQIGSRFRKIVESVKFADSGEMIHPKISIGITQARPGDTVDTLIVRAEKLMKQAKENPENYIVTDLEGTGLQEMR